MGSLSFLELAALVLGETKQMMTPVEIWRYAESAGYATRLETRGKTPWDTLSARLYVDTRDNANTKFVRSGARPVRFHLKGIGQGPPPPDSGGAGGYTERDLHPFVAYFAYKRLKAHVKTILHERAKKASYGDWVYPDLVGFSYPVRDWETRVLDVSARVGSPPVLLYSFEVKKSLRFANLREAFFQAVSNSSWAHYGYLAAAQIALEDDFRDELRRLCSAHRIGVISLSPQNPDDADFIVEAPRRDPLDWETINKLCALSPDFAEFLHSVEMDVGTKTIHKSDYDPVPDPEALASRFRAQIRRG